MNTPIGYLVACILVGALAVAIVLRVQHIRQENDAMQKMSRFGTFQEQAK